jgi:hypothetical protein
VFDPALGDRFKPGTHREQGELVEYAETERSFRERDAERRARRRRAMLWERAYWFVFGEP